MRANPRDRAREYFGHPGFRRMLSDIWRKYATLERAGGQVRIASLTEEECEAINGLFGWNLRPGDTANIPLALFERELERSPFPFSIPELHAILERKPLLTRSEWRILRNNEWKRLFEPVYRRVCEDGEASEQARSAVRAWLRRLESGEALGYRTLRDAYRQEPEQSARDLFQVTEALLAVSRGCRLVCGEEQVPLSWIRLPVLAACMTGDAHAFDPDRPAGRLLWYALKECSGLTSPNAGQRDGNDAEETYDANDADVAVFSEHAHEPPEESFERDAMVFRQVYRAAGIMDDDISSWVHVFFAHPQAVAEPHILTLRQVERMEEIVACSSLYVVENPSVFSTLVDAVDLVRGRSRESNGGRGHRGEPYPVLICTSGQPSAAAVLLMQRLLERSGSTCRLYYSGDFDVKGLEIGRMTARRFAGRFVPWRFGTATYERWANNGPPFSDTERERLRHLRPEWEEHLGKTLADKGKKCFQESFVGELVRDWLKALETG